MLTRKKKELFHKTRKKKELLNFLFTLTKRILLMTVTSISTDIPAQTGVNTRLMRIVCTDTIDTITTAGYLNASNLEGYTVQEFDFFHIYYGSTSASFGVFAVSINADTGVVTLNQTASPANTVLLSGASVVGNLPKFNSTAGQLIDSGAKILAGVTASFGGGSTSNAYTVTGLDATSYGSAVILTSANTASIIKAVPSTNTLTVTFSADPGAGTTVTYMYATAALS